MRVSELVQRIVGNKYKDIPKEYLEIAANYGTRMHKFFELYLENNNILAMIEEEFNEKDERIFTNFLKIVKEDELDKKELIIEKKLNYQNWLEGTPDLIVKEKDNYYTIYDWKTRTSLESEDNFLSEKLQILCYRKLFAEEEVLVEEQVKMKIILFSKRSKKMKIIELTKKEISLYNYILEVFFAGFKILYEHNKKEFNV